MPFGRQTRPIGSANGSSEKRPSEQDIRSAISYARRLELDPFDAPFTRDNETGQFWVRIDSTVETDQVLVCSFGIDAANRRVNVTAFTYLRDNFTG